MWDNASVWKAEHIQVSLNLHFVKAAVGNWLSKVTPTHILPVCVAAQTVVWIGPKSQRHVGIVADFLLGSKRRRKIYLVNKQTNKLATCN